MARLRFIRIMYLTDTELKCIRQSGFLRRHDARFVFRIRFPSKYTTSCKLATSAAAHEFHQFLADEQSKLVGTEEPA